MRSSRREEDRLLAFAGYRASKLGLTIQTISRGWAVLRNGQEIGASRELKGIQQFLDGYAACLSQSEDPALTEDLEVCQKAAEAAKSSRWAAATSNSQRRIVDTTTHRGVLEPVITRTDGCPDLDVPQEVLEYIAHFDPTKVLSLILTCTLQMATLNHRENRLNTLKTCSEELLKTHQIQLDTAQSLREEYLEILALMKGLFSKYPEWSDELSRLIQELQDSCAEETLTPECPQ